MARQQCKLVDFISKIVHFYINQTNEHMTSMRILFLRCSGYMAPEYFANELVSTTADIFSLGVIIIELMTGHRDYPSTEESHEQFVEKFLFIISLHTHEKKRYSDANTTKQ